MVHVWLKWNCNLVSAASSWAPFREFRVLRRARIGSRLFPNDNNSLYCDVSCGASEFICNKSYLVRTTVGNMRNYGWQRWMILEHQIRFRYEWLCSRWHNATKECNANELQRDLSAVHCTTTDKIYWFALCGVSFEPWRISATNANDKKYIFTTESPWIWSHSHACIPINHFLRSSRCYVLIRR